MLPLFARLFLVPFFNFIFMIEDISLFSTFFLKKIFISSDKNIVYFSGSSSACRVPFLLYIIHLEDEIMLLIIFTISSIETSFSVGFS